MDIIDVFTCFIAFATFLFIAFKYVKWKKLYWERRNVLTAPPMEKNDNLLDYIRRIYRDAKSKNLRHLGFYLTIFPAFLPIDLDLIKHILVRDFQFFTNRGIYYNEKDDPLSAHLVSIDNPKWRFLRSKLTPTFSSGRMKAMFCVLAESQVGLLKALDRKCELNGAIDVKDILSRFTIDVIGSCAFGLDCKSFEDDHSAFRVNCKKAVTSSGKWRTLLRRFVMLVPDTARFLRIRTVPKDTAEFFMKIVKENVEYREKNLVDRNDFLQLLLKLKKTTLDDDQGLSIEEIAAQCFVFFLGGFETSASTMSFALYEIARNPDLQERLIEEVEFVVKKFCGKITYEAIQDMKLLSQTIDETLRIYPPGPFLIRKCVKDYKLFEENIVIDKGTTVFVPVYGIHYDEEFYPDPEKFDPERFSEENKKSRPGSAYLPFGDGPRNCIGLRFGLMQTKFGLASLLKNYKFTPNAKTHLPLKINKKAPLLTCQGEIWLDVHKL